MHNEDSKGAADEFCGAFPVFGHLYANAGKTRGMKKKFQTTSKGDRQYVY